VKSPTISAVVPVYNGQGYIGEAVEAILSQTRPPGEVIVVDDGSTDGTREELKRFEGEVRVITQTNRGVAGALNRCFEEATGMWVAKCDADDVWEPEKLQRQAEMLKDHPQVDIAVAGASFFGLREGSRAPYQGEGILDPKELKRRLYKANFICSSATVVRQALHRAVGPFDGGLACEDYDFWLRAVGAGATVYYDPRAMVKYREHQGQVSKAKLEMHEAEYAVHRRHAKLVDDRRLVKRVEANDLFNIGRAMSDEDRTDEARKAFKASMKRRPTARAAAWAIVVSAPERYRRGIADRAVSIKRAAHGAAETKAA
jgi:glycosyltransferase involved in cell wall biosynthesis